MSETVSIVPVINYPQTATLGQTYLMTVDLQFLSPADEWPYPEEEYALHCLLDAYPLFHIEPIGESVIIIHRFGGTYGPARFLLTPKQPVDNGYMQLTLTNDSRMPLQVIPIEGITIHAGEVVVEDRVLIGQRQRIRYPSEETVNLSIERQRQLDSNSTINDHFNGYALIIGVSIQNHKRWSKPISMHNVDGVYIVLTSPEFCGYGRENVRIMTDESGTRKGVLEGLIWLQECSLLNPEATFFIYYSGYGWHHSGDDTYLVLNGSLPENIRNSGISSKELAVEIDKIASCVMVFDCDSFSMEIGETLFNERNNAPVTSERAIYSSCSSNERSWLHPSVNRSIYTYYLIKMLEGAASLPENRDIRHSLITEYVHQTVITATRTLPQVKPQNPLSWSRSTLPHIILGFCSTRNYIEPVNSIISSPYLFDNAIAVMIIIIARPYNGNYPIQFITSIGEHVNSVLDYSSVEFLTKLWQSEGSLSIEGDTINLGQQLYNNLFQGASLALLQGITTHATLGDLPLQIRLEFDPFRSLMPVARLPWEFLTENDQQPLGNRYSIVRSVPNTTPIPPYIITGPLKLLLVWALPVEGDATVPDDIHIQAVTIAARLQPLVSAGKITIEILAHATPSTLQRAIHDSAAHIMHIISHSTMPSGDTAYIVLEDTNRGATLLSIRDLGVALRHSNIRLAIFNNCNSEKPIDTLMHAIGSAFLAAKVPAVLGMNMSSTDVAGDIFVLELYRTLLSTGSIDQAVIASRKALISANMSVQKWAMPVLYHQAKNGQLFQEIITNPVIARPDQPSQPVSSQYTIGQELGISNELVEPEINNFGNSAIPDIEGSNNTLSNIDVQSTSDLISVHRTPFMAPPLNTVVERSEQFEAIREAVLESQAGKQITITTVIRGAGGFGKTMMASMICHDAMVQAVFSDGILWTRLGEDPDLQESIRSLYSGLTGDVSRFTSLEDAVERLGEVLKQKRCLIVLDDVWTANSLDPFYQINTPSTWLITTRMHDIAPNAASIFLDGLTTEEAIEILTMQLTEPPPDVTPLEQVAKRLGNWPLLLSLAGAYLADQVRFGKPFDQVLSDLINLLDKDGLHSLNQRIPPHNDTIVQSIQINVDLLDMSTRQHLLDLVVFPEHLEISLKWVALLWEVSEQEADNIVKRLAQLSLVWVDSINNTIHLHPLIRTHLMDLFSYKEDDLLNIARAGAIVAMQYPKLQVELVHGDRRIILTADVNQNILLIQSQSKEILFGTIEVR
jgi:hypothetical protein